MPSMDSYSRTATERAMKVQEVILRAMAKKITLGAGGRDQSASATGRCGVGGNVTKFGYDK